MTYSIFTVLSINTNKNNINNVMGSRWIIQLSLLNSKVKVYQNLFCITEILNTIFDNTINLVFSTCQHKYKWILFTEKLVLNMSFQVFWCTNINNYLICFEKTISTYLKDKNSLHTTRIWSFKYVSIVFSKITDAKI